MKHLTKEELEAGLDNIRQSPKNNGVLELIVARPAEDQRIVLHEADLTLEDGVVGDNWKSKGSSSTPDGSANPEMQLNITNSRIIALLAVSKDRWSLAGDQLYVDLDLSDENLPVGSQLAIGSVVIEVTAIPHNGCKKFADRYGVEAVKFVNTAEGKRMHLRGVNAKVVQAGTINQGDLIQKV